jgi:hypothetical protein
MSDIAQQIALSSNLTHIEKQAMLDEINMNDMNISDGLIKMLRDVEPMSTYK